MKRIHNRLAILLTFALLLSLAAPVGAAGSRITIRTPEDLVELSRRCSLDSWSRGKTVVLSADLDLSDVEFSSIPTFGGTFDGQGYTISGLTITGSGNVRGLFRYLQSGGVVQNVSLEVTIDPTDLQDSLGGLVGNNRGSVRIQWKDHQQHFFRLRHRRTLCGRHCGAKSGQHTAMCQSREDQYRRSGGRGRPGRFG